MARSSRFAALVFAFLLVSTHAALAQEKDLSCLKYQSKESLFEMGACVGTELQSGNRVAAIIIKELMYASGGEFFIEQLPHIVSEPDLTAVERTWMERISTLAAQGDPFSRVVAGAMRLEGLGGPSDKVSATTLWAQGAADGFGPAAYAWALRSGEDSTTQEEVQARLELAAEWGVPGAWWELGKRAEERGQHDEAARHWAVCADLGQTLCAYTLGVRLAEGLDVAQDTERARHYLTMAASHGHPEAADYLGVLPGGEDGGPDSDERAEGQEEWEDVRPPEEDLSCLAWVDRSSFETIKNCVVPFIHDNVIALAIYRQVLHATDTSLALDRTTPLRSKVVLSRDEERWYQFLSDGARKGDLFQSFMIGLLMNQNVGPICDNKEAYRLWTEGAEAGFGPAALLLGKDMILPGVKVPQAVSYLEQAGNWGIAEAWFILGIHYRTGRRVPLDLPRSVAYFRRGAELGHPVCRYELGLSLAEGTGTATNKEEARLWLRKAADQGVQLAEQYLVLRLEDEDAIRQRTFDEEISANPLKRAADLLRQGDVGNPSLLLALRQVKDTVPTLDLDLGYGQGKVHKHKTNESGLGLTIFRVRLDRLIKSPNDVVLPGTPRINYIRYESSKDDMMEVRLLVAQAPGAFVQHAFLLPLSPAPGPQTHWTNIRTEGAKTPWPPEYRTVIYSMKTMDLYATGEYALCILSDSDMREDIYLGLVSYNRHSETRTGTHDGFQFELEHHERMLFAFDLESDRPARTVLLESLNPKDMSLFYHLLETGADINDGPVVAAAMNSFDPRDEDSFRAMRQIIDLGADPNSAVGNGWRPVHLLARRMDNVGEYVEEFDKGLARFVDILKKAGTDLDALTPQGKTALIIASEHREAPRLVRALLDAGADPTVRDPNGLTAREIAEQQGLMANIIELNK